MDRSFSKLGKVNIGDWLRGLLVAAATSPLTVIYESLSAGKLTFNWKNLLVMAAIGGLGYILKNLATGSGGQLFTNKES